MDILHAKRIFSRLIPGTSRRPSVRQPRRRLARPEAGLMGQRTRGPDDRIDPAHRPTDADVVQFSGIRAVLSVGDGAVLRSAASTARADAVDRQWLLLHGVHSEIHL